jgi:hypothetical protein
LGVLAIEVHQCLHSTAHQALEVAGGGGSQTFFEQLELPPLLALQEGIDERYLAREVLVERTNTDPSDLRDPVGVSGLIALVSQNASSCLNKG